MRSVDKNKKLCEKYPFLMPKDDPEYDYSWTWADDMPQGWWIAFGEMMCEEIKAELIKWKFLDEYQIVQIKEKYGSLRWYDNGIPSGCNVWDIIEKYSVLSENICIKCGKPDVPMMTYGWIFPVCEKHAPYKDEYETCAEEQYPHKMSSERKYSSYKNDKWIDHVIDISDTAEKIRRAYADRNNG